VSANIPGKQLVSANAPNGDGDVSSHSRPACFPRSARLLRHADFERVYKQGRRHFAAHLTVFYLRRAEGEGARVGFTVSRALGDAVDRNRMKRRLREVVRRHGTAIGVSVDVVINPKKSLLTAEFSDLVNEIDKAFVVIEQKLGEVRQ
jgi:ribonuclease P protein component